jgi:hypothetical protein
LRALDEARYCSLGSEYCGSFQRNIRVFIINDLCCDLVATTV